jgi:flagellar biosynthesis chaperone FliJ
MKQIALQQEAVERQMEKVREAKLEISSIEKLRERKLEEYNYLDNKAQEQFIEEFVSTAKAMSEIAG